MNNEEIACVSDRYLMYTYGERVSAFVRGRGTRVWDADGKEYLDMLSGIGVCILGHCHREVTSAIEKQARELIHVSNLYYTRPQAEFAKLLVENSFADKVFFCNSGSEANEAAIKLSRKFGCLADGSSGRYEIITMENSFHGRTIAAMTATGQEKFKTGFGPLLPGFKYVPLNDIHALKKAVGEKTIAIMAEPIQGEGGDRICNKQYLQEVRRLCDEENILLIFDEVQCGLGRTGKLFAYEHYGIKPDIMTLAKPLGGGLPLGAILSTDEAAGVLQPGTHASTFGGNPVACAGGIAVLQVILREDLVERAQILGDYLLKKLSRLKEKCKQVTDVRGKGLMAGIELSSPCREIVKECMRKGVLLNCTAETFIRFLPPLIVTEEEIDSAVEVLEQVIKGC